MLFNSLQFLIFFPIVTTIYFLLPHRFRWMFILAASCYFYMVFIPKYIFILAVMIAVDYFAGIGLEKTEGRRRFWILAAGLATNLGMLAFFKYFNFANENVAALAHFIGWNYPIPNLSLLLPIGLSFHTFQSVSYLLEIYNGRQAAERHFGILAVFVMFFPQLVAGPIERPQRILPQLHAEHHFDYRRVADGLKWMAWGLFKKTVVADGLALLVNPIFASPSNFGGPAFAFAGIAFAIQIYCDFSGYSDIALGSAQVLGIQLTRNFNHPYFARSISEFWQRWHISLSSWFRDYVFFPVRRWLLRRQNRLPDWFNRAIPTLVTMFLSGLWHGANWTYILWGLLHGIYIVAEETIERGWSTRPIAASRLPSALRSGLSILTTFLLVSFALIFFRATTLTEAFYIIQHLFTGWGALFVSPSLDAFLGSFLSLAETTRSTLLFNLLAFLILLAVEILQFRGDFLERFNTQQPAIRLLSYASLIILIMVLGAYTDTQQVFIYFQF